MPALITLDQALDRILFADYLFREVSRRLKKTCKDHEVLPLSYLIPGEKLSITDVTLTTEKYSITRKAKFEGGNVSVKVLASRALGTGVTANKVCSFVARSCEPPLKPVLIELLRGGRCVEEVTTSRYRSFPRDSYQDIALV